VNLPVTRTPQSRDGSRSPQWRSSASGGSIVARPINRRTRSSHRAYADASRPACPRCQRREPSRPSAVGRPPAQHLRVEHVHVSWPVGAPPARCSCPCGWHDRSDGSGGRSTTSKPIPAIRGRSGVSYLSKALGRWACQHVRVGDHRGLAQLVEQRGQAAPLANSTSSSRAGHPGVGFGPPWGT
jgi:hypothetical protein